MEFWLNPSNILENLELEDNSVVSQVIHMVGVIGGALSQEAPEGQVDPVLPHSGEGNSSTVPENSGEDSALIGCDKVCSDDGQESREDRPKNPVNEEQPAGREEEEKEEENNADDEKNSFKDISQDLREQENHNCPDVQISELNVYNYSLASCSSQSPLPQHNSQSVEMTVDEVTSGELADLVPGPGCCAADTASGSIEQEREEAGTEARDLSREAFVTSSGSDHSGDDQNVTVLSGESSTVPDTHPRPEPQTQTHTSTSAPPDTQTELSSFPAEAPISKEPPETTAGPPTPSGPEELSPVTKPPELEAAAEPPGVGASPGVETGSVETTSQHPAEAETLPEEAGTAELETAHSETPPVPVPESQPEPNVPATVPESQPEPETQPTPAPESGPDPEPETQTEAEINVKQEQASAPLEEKTTSMEEAKQLLGKLMGGGPGHKDAGPNHNAPSKEPEEEIEVEEDGAHGGAPEKGSHGSQNDPSRPQGETHGEEKNHPNVSRYKTVSYRKIRKGNTKQRIDEFESIINT